MNKLLPLLAALLLLSADIESLAEIRKVFSPNIPKNLVWPWYRVNHAGNLVTWERNQTVKVFDPSGKPILNWPYIAPYYNTPIVGENALYFESDEALQGFGEKNPAYWRVEFPSGAVKELPGKAGPLYPVCQTDRIIWHVEKAYLLWNGERIEGTTRFGFPPYWAMHGETCKIAFDGIGVEVLLEVDAR